MLVTTLMLGGLLIGSVTACSSSRTSESTGEYIDDSVINNKVRAEIVGDKDLSLFQIDVASFKGVVQLSGFVNSQAAKDRAGAIAAGVSGVKQVHNNLIVK
jgi:osmotically-inducible protein OsmY